MIRYEVKKGKEGITYKIIITLLFIVLAVIIIAPVRSYSYISSSDEMPLKGMAAIKEIKNSYKKGQRELSIEYLNEAFTYYRSFTNVTEGEFETNKKYPGVLLLIMKAYGTVEEPLYDLSGVTTITNFYDRNKIEIEKYSKEHKENSGQILKKLEKIHSPYHISFSKSWINMWKTMMILGFYLSIVAILIGAKTFSMEREIGMDKILCTIHKNKKKIIAKNKIKSLIFLLSKWYFFSIFIILTVKIVTTGVSGISSEIQTEYFFSMFSLSFGVATLIYILLEWLGVITIGLTSVWISLFAKKSSSAFIAIVFLIYIPFLLGNIGGKLGDKFMKLIHLAPIYSMDFISGINRLELYFGSLSQITVLLMIESIFIVFTYVSVSFIYPFIIKK